MQTHINNNPKTIHDNGFDYLKAIAAGDIPPPVLSSDIRF
jgi:hypothetical protein